jgi:hypothetical protein
MQRKSLSPEKQLHEKFHFISMETLSELARRDLLQIDGDEWRFGDESNGTTRKFSYPKYKRADNSGDEWHKLIGLDDVVRNDRREVLFVIEGSKDALAAAEIARRNGALSGTGILCALGSGYRPIRAELEQLRGRRVGVIGDNDAAGIETTKIVSDALSDVGVEHAIWNWSACRTNEKDLAGWLATVDTNFCPIFTTFFLPLSPSYHSTNQPVNQSTSESAGLNEDERMGIVVPFILTKKGTGHALSFQLARKIKPRKLNMQEIKKIHELWFARSLPFLPPGDNADKSLAKFFSQLEHVRFTNSALQSACERARRAKPPFIPARDGDDELAKLAALCRELQRNAGDRAFICPVNVVVDFIPVRWPSQANYLLHVLEEEKVIECVERGAPNKKGVKGKATLWRYKLTME